MIGRLAPIVGAAVALFLAGYAAGTCGKPTNAALEAAHDSTQAAVERAAELERARAEIENQARADSVRFAARADSALTIARAAAARRPTVIDRIVEREAPADTMVARRVAVAVTDSLVEHEIRPRDVALAAKDSALASMGRDLASERATRIAAQQGLERAMVEIGLLRDQRPSWLSRNWEKGAVVLAGYAGWRARGEVEARR